MDPRPPKAPRWTKADATKLAQVAADTLAGIYPRANPEDYKTLLHYGHVEFNTADIDPAQDGLFPIRATAQGMQESGVSTPGAIDPEPTRDNMPEVINPADAAPKETKPVSDDVTNTVGDTAAPATAAARVRLNIAPESIKLGVASGLPQKAKGGPRGRRSAYPFASLVAPKVVSENETHYANFFLPNTEGREDMKRLVQGNVTAYNGKVKDQIDPATGKAAKFEAYDAEVDGVKGVAVYRVQ